MLVIAINFASSIDDMTGSIYVPRNNTPQALYAICRFEEIHV
jgi:hypothetical protein